ncbi:hypothetical protein [Neorhizobium galegae]|uniref:hypothetical protein n=1 Tax=Neorhizobium galegae TaxID=399 RepID=UPI0006211727|nr:hypothetical protein [Neorhizobium galegae]CDZ58690.1 Hypothetical protein NGAL_HAMBI2566_31150 [Neorhizobium galegae bv. orientalis]KAB1121451.1 hypothetical protein F4V90_25310 [Neorhizobium galegae]MCQ1570543.1 hypothetical protein [Neorhizobium galegae]MCQ1809221.1 hypothetical protein [Neorhizobium galegae]CDZ71673.1 Hypothetical protein NGAL_HAMBI2610_32890 [Neorhizobium galegae bv. orientalis]
MVSSAEDVFDSLAFMSVSSNFVRDFFTESNQIHSISRSEGQWLTEQAAATIADPRESLAVSSNVVALTKDLTADFRKLLVNFDGIPPELIVGALIRCADEIMCLQKLSQYSRLRWKFTGYSLYFLTELDDGDSRVEVPLPQGRPQRLPHCGKGSTCFPYRPSSPLCRPHCTVQRPQPSTIIRSRFPLIDRFDLMFCVSA